MQDIFIEIQNKDCNLNTFINLARSNKFASSSHKKRIQAHIRPQLAKLDKIHTPCKIVAIWHVERLNSDLDNLCLKYFLDELQKLGKLENDNMKNIVEIRHKIEVNKNMQGVHLYFLKVDENVKFNNSK